MNKKILFILLLTGILMSSSACTQDQPSDTGNTGTVTGTGTQPAWTEPETTGTLQQEQSGEQGENFDYLGIRIPKSALWQEYGENVRSNGILTDYLDAEGSRYGLVVDDFLADEILAAIKSEKTPGPLRENVANGTRNLFQILIYGKGKAPDLEKIKETTLCKYVNKISEENNFVYFFCWNDLDEKGLSKESAAKYKQLYEEMLGFKQNLHIYPPDETAVEAKRNERVQMEKDAEKALKELDAKEAASKDALEKKKKIGFETKDLDGNPVSSDLFKDNQLTMINIWATFCGPCIEEMPGLQALSEELKAQDVQVLGLVGDTAGEDGQEDKANIALARDIVKSKKVNYTNLINNKALEEAFPVAAYPTTVFVDKKGNVVGEVVVGSKGKAEYKKLIEKALEEIKKGERK